MEKYVLFTILCLSMLIACNEKKEIEVECEEGEEVPLLDPAVAILGKWELVAQGWGVDEMRPPFSPWFIEYLPDGITQVCNNEEQRYHRSYDYRIDSLLYELVEMMDDSRTLVVNTSYKYTFLDDRMVLKIVYQNWFNIISFGDIYIYKRKNDIL